jgi:dipeptidyl aminopeptidase/acylaminoacyl peptidase
MMPQWSPDGTMIASMTFHPNMTTVTDGIDSVVVRADGSSQSRLWTEQSVDGSPMWSPDGSRLSLLIAPVMGEDLEDYGVVLVEPGGGTPQPIVVPPLTGAWTGAAFSPDGTLVLGRSPTLVSEGPPGDIQVITVDGSATPVTIPGPGYWTASW